MAGIVERIRARSREEWLELWKERWTEVRIWVQEHGELSLILGIVSGLLIVLAFRLVVGLLVIAVAFGLSVWLIALPQQQFSYDVAEDEEDEAGEDDSTDDQPNGESV